MGRREFETVVASAPREQLINFANTSSAVLGPGGSEIVRFYAAPNTIVNLIGGYISFPAPSGATTGYHEVWMSYDDPTVDVLHVRNNFSDGMLFSASMWNHAPTLLEPDTNETQLLAFRGIQVDSITALRIQYENNTDVATPAGSIREIRLWGIQKTLGGE